MKLPGADILTCLAFLAVAAQGAIDAPRPGTENSPAPVAALIARLADENFGTREAATRQLWEVGEAAVPALRDAALGSNPEVAYRARDVLRKLALFITPGTDAAIIALVERYQQAGDAAKPELLNRLRIKRAYRQILRLHATETNSSLAAEQLPMVEAVALTAAREALLSGRTAEAKSLLEIAPPSDAGLLALATFHRANGTLAQELELAKDSVAKGAAAWRLALLRAKGDAAAAFTEAVAANKPGVAALMAALQGDPLPWLEFGNPKGSTISDLYTPLAIKRWQGAPLTKSDFSAISNRFNSRSENARLRAFKAAYALGEPALAESAVTKLDPFGAFSIFDSEERVDDALKAIGLNPATPDFTKLCASRFASLLNDPDEAGKAIDELAAIAMFLENRGLDSELKAAFDTPMTQLADRQVDAFSELLDSMTGRGRPLGRAHGGATSLVQRVARTWAGDDDERWEHVLVGIFGDNPETIPCWSWLGTLHPEADRAARFSGMMALAGLGSDPDGCRGEWLQRIRRNLEQAEPAVRAEGLNHLIFLLGDEPDVDSQLAIIDLRNLDQKAEAAEPEGGDEPAADPVADPFADDGDGLVERDPFDRETARSMLYLAGGNRWQQAAEIALRLLAQNHGRAGTRADLHAYAAACFRRAGDEAQAAEHDAWVEQLALGDAMLALRIAGGYAFGDDYERASLWQRRAAFEVAPEPLRMADVFNAYATDAIAAGNWPQAAAASEIVSQIYAGVEFGGIPLLPVLRRFRQQADLAHALALLPTERERAVAMLASCHALSPCDASLADNFFPAVRAAGLVSEHDAWFAISWKQIQAVIKRFPQGYNTLNSAAWLASRAARNLDVAETDLKRALAIYPRQGAFLDTMAEIQFARGRREEAVNWSLQSVNAMPNDGAIRRQYHRFRSAPFPK